MSLCSVSLQTDGSNGTKTKKIPVGFLRKQISGLAKTVSSNAEAIQKLNELPSKIDQLMEMFLSNSNSESNDIEQQNQNTTDLSDPIGSLLNSEQNGKITQQNTKRHCSLYLLMTTE